MVTNVEVLVSVELWGVGRSARKALMARFAAGTRLSRACLCEPAARAQGSVDHAARLLALVARPLMRETRRRARRSVTARHPDVTSGIGRRGSAGAKWFQISGEPGRIEPS